MGGDDFSEYSLPDYSIPAVYFHFGAVAPAKIAEFKQAGKELPTLHSSKFAPVPEPTIRTGMIGMIAAVLDLMNLPRARRRRRDPLHGRRGPAGQAVARQGPGERQVRPAGLDASGRGQGRQSGAARCDPGRRVQQPDGRCGYDALGGEYAIHGTNKPESIGKFASYGCIRMQNEDITDLFERVDVGTQVVVLR